MKIPMMKKFNTITGVISFCLVIWLLLFLMQSFQLKTPDQISHIAAQIEFLVHVFMLIVVFRIYKNAAAEDRKVLKWLLIANIGLLANDFSFYLVTYFRNTTGPNSKLVAFLIDLIPFYLWIYAIITFFSAVLRRAIPNRKRYVKMLIPFAIMNLIVISLFLSSINYALGAWTDDTIAQASTFIAQIIVFDFAILCLMYSENRGFSLLLSGFIILMSGDFFLIYSYISQTVILLGYGELLWLLGLAFILFGLMYLLKDKSYTIDSLVRQNTSIKSKLVFWSFSVSVISFLLFFVIGYSFSIVNKDVFLSLPLFIMIYSVIVITLSVFMGKTLEAPFKKITANIEVLMHEKDKSLMDHKPSSIEEFIFLQAFIANAFKFKEEKDQAKKKLGAIATQVAHNMLTPVAALLVLTQKCTGIPEEERIVLREATQTIQDIANNVTNQYRITEERGIDHSDKMPWQELLISTLILEILSEKRLQYRNRDIKIKAKFTPKAHFAFIIGNQTEFKRMLSNMINNAVDACKDVARIQVALDVSDKHVILSIADNGKGMPQELIARIMNKEAVTADKENGHGIGLNHAHQTLQRYKGSMEIHSAIGEGTAIKLIFRLLKTPGWIANQIEIIPGSIVIVLDDDSTVIHRAWDHRFQDIAKANNLQVVHFEQGAEALDYIISLTESEKSTTFLLTDYELLNQKMNGLDALEASGIKHSVLVTSHYANKEIVTRAALLGAKVLPKVLAVEVPINLKAPGEVTAIEPVDIIIVDDKPRFMKTIIDYKLSDKKVKYYEDPYLFIKEHEKYAKDTPICLDNDFGIQELNGRDLAKKLHADGYEHLYLISGSHFDDLPEYLIALDKHDVQKALNKHS